jgi:hypothetical protein
MRDALHEAQRFGASHFPYYFSGRYRQNFCHKRLFTWLNMSIAEAFLGYHLGAV